MNDIKYFQIRPGTRDEWNNQLYIPPLPPTNLRGCHLIKLNYDVFVSWPKADKPQDLWR